MSLYMLHISLPAPCYISNVPIYATHLTFWSLLYSTFPHACHIFHSSILATLLFSNTSYVYNFPMSDTFAIPHTRCISRFAMTARHLISPHFVPISFPTPTTLAPRHHCFINPNSPYPLQATSLEFYRPLQNKTVRTKMYTLVQGLRQCTGSTVHRGSRGIAVLYRH